MISCDMVYHQKDSLGQNFIKSRRLVSELLAETDLTKDDVVVEIGPGKGIITEQLCQIAGKVVAIEKDHLLISNLRERLKTYENLSIENVDFLEYKLPNERYKIVSNIPFSLTAEIIDKIVESDNLPESIYLIMQKEAADKFTGVDKETQSSILTKPWYEIEELGEIDRTNFTKKPQVKIVFVRFILRDNPLIPDVDKDDFRKFVKYGFGQWQPTMTKSYKKVLTFEQLKRIEGMLKIQNLKLTEVSFDKWLVFYKTVRKLTK